MTKSIFILGLLLLLTSCDPAQNCGTTPDPTAQKQDTTSVDCTPTEDPAEPTDPTEEPVGDVPAEALLFDADISLTKFDSNDEAKVTTAIEIIKKVIASQEFRSRVINFTYGSKKAFVDSKGLTNEEIYQKLLDGSEELVPGIDHQMDLELELYYSSRSTVGYTYPDGLRIWMNTKFFDAYTPAEVAGNVFHEWTHKLGFGHASNYSVSRDSSVPYALGYLIEELGKKYE